MLENYYVKPSTVDRIRANWLASDIERYVGWMHERGYTASSVMRRVPVLCEFAEFAKARGATDAGGALAAVDEFVARRLARRERQTVDPVSQFYRKAISGPIGQMLRLATEGRVGTGHKPKPFPFQAEAPGFLDHLREERGARPATVEHYGHGPGTFFCRYVTRLMGSDRCSCN